MSPSKPTDFRHPKCEYLTGIYALNSTKMGKHCDLRATGQPRGSDRLNVWASALSNPLSCVACKLQVKATENTLIYHLTTTYRIEKASDTVFSFIFPLTACDGTLSSFLARINKKIIMWELARVVSSPGEWPLLLNPAADNIGDPLRGGSENNGSKASVVYIVAPTVSNLLDKGEAEVGQEVQVEIRWTTKSVRRCTNVSAIVVAYPFACAPRLPGTIVYHTAFSREVKMVNSANSRTGIHALDWKARGKRCLVRLDEDDTNIMLKREDGLFVLTFFFENALESDQQCGVYALVLAVAVVALCVWFFLTKDLVL
uniref:Uncharacterized protein n=1 Tax=Trypanosoma congolense (strain IL3000) TaxID=1068625 RepID=G0UKX3_TRYCI|nr:conserved hypothetical protein [Trypanosoma congolense IL3000]